ncbi:Cof-type HAD-IIB family hydrolase [soil metagenome]
MADTSNTSVAPRLIVLDLDGTLLGADGLVSDRNASALERAADAGSRVVIATGRPVRWLEHLKSSLHSSIALCCNGGLVVDLDSGTILQAHELDGAKLQHAVTELRARGIVFALGVEGPPERGLMVERDYPFRGGADIAIGSLAELCSGSLVKALIRPIDSRSDEIREYLLDNHSDDFTLTRSTGDGLIELSLSGITKGSVIAGLAAEWGIEAGEAIAFGDMPNDIEMMRWAGRSVAMENADPSVHLIASESGAHHDDSGVGRVLERWF